MRMLEEERDIDKKYRAFLRAEGRWGGVGGGQGETQF